MPSKKIPIKKARSAQAQKSKKKVLDGEFFRNLADDIYDPMTGSYLRLCKGKLQNGPDPEDACRIMHCGLGEAYYAVKGDHPDPLSSSSDMQAVRAISDAVVDDLTARRPNMDRKALKSLAQALGTLERLGVVQANGSPDIEVRINKKFERELENLYYTLISVLGSIPEKNDSADSYVRRARRVRQAILQVANEIDSFAQRTRVRI